MAYTRSLSLPVIVAVLLITFVSYTVVVLVLKPWFGLFTAPGLLNLCAFIFLLTMLLISYYLSLSLDPGVVPPKFFPIEADDGRHTVPAGIQEVKRKGGDFRFCQKCLAYKPPRSHHCRICKRCVLRMDHHCIWINNCVGHHNYKAFFLFVLYAACGLLHALVLLLGHTARCMGLGGGNLGPTGCSERLGSEAVASAGAYSWLHPHPTTATALRVVCILITLPLAASLVVLLVWHVYLMASNKTTIEHYEGVRSRCCAPKAADLYNVHPYDLGLAENLHVILGPLAVCWLCPTANGHIGSGLRFPSTYERNPGQQMLL